MYENQFCHICTIKTFLYKSGILNRVKYGPVIIHDNLILLQYVEKVTEVVLVLRFIFNNLQCWWWVGNINYNFSGWGSHGTKGGQDTTSRACVDDW